MICPPNCPCRATEPGAQFPPLTTANLGARFVDPALLDRPVKFAPEPGLSLVERLRAAGLDWRSLAILGAVLALVILV